MKYIRRDESKFKAESRGHARFDYGDFEAFNFSKIEISGRYPEMGEKTAEATGYYFITFGDGEINIDGQKVFARKGDLVKIEKGEVYYFNGKFDAATVVLN